MRTRNISILSVGVMVVLAVFPLAATADHNLVVPFENLDEIPEGATEPPSPWAAFIDARDDDNRTGLIGGFRGDGVRVTIPAFTHRGIGGIARLDPTADEAWFRYYLRLDSWNASSSGKLPGLAGLYSSSARGCIPSTPSSPGWSARTMFEATGTEGAGPGEVRLGTYLYHLDQAGTCGDQIMWEPGVVQQDRWYCVEGHVKMNTPGQNDGRVDAWVDGAVALQWPGVAFRRLGEDVIGARHLWANVYFGGTVVNASNLAASIDEMVFSHTGRVFCIDPFSDDNNSLHEADIRELYALGVLVGCGGQLVCPRDVVTRGQMAAFLQRALKLSGGTDAFTDDDGHFAEAAINAIAGAGVTKGCTATSFCPDQPVSRGEMAVFLDRALSLPSSDDAFSDDNGHWAETSINALSASGITKGCRADAFCPDDSVTREQMASFIRRGIVELPVTTLGLAESTPVGELIPGTFDDSSEPAPVFD